MGFRPILSSEVSVPFAIARQHLSQHGCAVKQNLFGRRELLFIMSDRLLKIKLDVTERKR